MEYKSTALTPGFCLGAGVTTFSASLRRQYLLGFEYSTRNNFVEWEVLFAAPEREPFAISAHAVDVIGNKEPRPHQITIPSGE